MREERGKNKEQGKGRKHIPTCVFYGCVLLLVPTYVLRVPSTPSTGAQSKEFTCEHTESAVPTEPAYDASSLGVSTVPTTLSSLSH